MKDVVESVNFLVPSAVVPVQCDYDPREFTGLPIGMFHCPKCGDMVIAGLPHAAPDLGEAEGEGGERDEIISLVLARVGKRWRSVPVEKVSGLEINGEQVAICADIPGAAAAVVSYALDKMTEAAYHRGLETAAKLVCRLCCQPDKYQAAELNGEVWAHRYATGIPVNSEGWASFCKAAAIRTGGLMDKVSSMLDGIKEQPCVVCGDKGDTMPCVTCDKLVCEDHRDGAMNCLDHATGEAGEERMSE